jgi:predicted thioesterase
MKESFEYELVHQYEVKASDVPVFEEKVVHPVCATYTLAREIEWATRQFILNIVSEEEEGIGTEIHIRHVSPARVGETIEIYSAIYEWENNELICVYEVRVKERIVAIGRTGQKILKRSRLEKLYSKNKHHE